MPDSIALKAKQMAEETRLAEEQIAAKAETKKEVESYI